MRVPSKSAVMEAIKSSKDKEARALQQKIKTHIEVVSSQLLVGKLRVKIGTGNELVIKGVLEAFRKKGYTVEVVVTNEYESRTARTVLLFTLDEEE